MLKNSRGISLFILLFLISSCASSEQINLVDELSQKRMEADRRIVVAKVGDVEITKERVDAYARFLAPKIVPHGGVRKKRMDLIREQALGEIIIKELRFKEGELRGISVDKKLLESDLKKMGQGLPPGKTLDQILAEKGRDRGWITEYLIKNRVVNTLMKQVFGEISDAVEKKTGSKVVKAYYDENLEKFRNPDKIRVREILLKVPPGSPSELWSKSRKKAAWIIERAKAGDSFSSLAKEFSDDAYAEKGGDMGLVSVNNLMSELQSAVSVLNVGDVAGPVYSMYGHHVVKVLEMKKGVLSPFDSVKDKISDYLKGVEKRRMMEEWVTDLKEKTKVVYLYDFKKEGPIP